MVRGEQARCRTNCFCPSAIRYPPSASRPPRMSRYELTIGRRYLRSGRGNRFVSFISVISMLGVAIGVAVLIVVLSVMNGVEQELRGPILSLTSHATINALRSGLADLPGGGGERCRQYAGVGARPGHAGPAV